MKKLVIAAVLLLLGGAWYSAVGNYVKKPQEYEQLIKSAEEMEAKEIYYDAILNYQAALEYKSGNLSLNYKIAEYTQAVLKDKPHFHISFIMNVSPECDCWNHNDAAIIPDLGILASFDPVALDKACADLVIAAPVIGGNKLSETHPHEHLQGTDKFHLIHPDTNWLAGLQHAEKIGVGTLDYELISV